MPQSSLTDTPSRAASGGGARTALIVDPHAEEALALARYLTERGWSVETIGEARQALRALERSEPGVLLLELEGSIDGLELVPEIMASHAPPILVLSLRQATAAALDAPALRALGVAGVIVRPCSF